jgi:hypothetical protein
MCQLKKLAAVTCSVEFSKLWLKPKARPKSRLSSSTSNQSDPGLRFRTRRTICFEIWVPFSLWRAKDSFKSSCATVDKSPRGNLPSSRWVALSILLLGIEAGFNPISACFNLIGRIHSQPINGGTPYGRSTQQLKASSVEIKVLAPRIFARVE